MSSTKDEFVAEIISKIFDDYNNYLGDDENVFFTSYVALDGGINFLTVYDDGKIGTDVTSKYYNPNGNKLKFTINSTQSADDDQKFLNILPIDSSDDTPSYVLVYKDERYFIYEYGDQTELSTTSNPVYSDIIFLDLTFVDAGLTFVENFLGITSPSPSPAPQSSNTNPYEDAADWIQLCCQPGPRKAESSSYYDDICGLATNMESSEYCDNYYDYYCNIADNKSDDVCACISKEVSDDSWGDLFDENNTNYSDIDNVESCFNSTCISDKAYKPTTYTNAACPYFGIGKVVSNNEGTLSNKNVEVTLSANNSDTKTFSPSSSNSPSPSPSPSPTTNSKNIYWWIWVIVSVIVLAIILIVIYLIRK